MLLAPAVPSVDQDSGHHIGTKDYGACLIVLACGRGKHTSPAPATDSMGIAGSGPKLWKMGERGAPKNETGRKTVSWWKGRWGGLIPGDGHELER